MYIKNFVGNWGCLNFFFFNNLLSFIYLFIYFLYFFVVVVVAISWAAPAAYGGSQARG